MGGAAGSVKASPADIRRRRRPALTLGAPAEKDQVHRRPTGSSARRMPRIDHQTAHAVASDSSSQGPGSPREVKGEMLLNLAAAAA